MHGVGCKFCNPRTHAGVEDHPIIDRRNKAHTVSTVEPCFKGGEVHLETDIALVALEHVA
jgi:hypothetical protein